MVKIIVKYLVKKSGKNGPRYYWQPKARYLVQGKWQAPPIKARRLSAENCVTEAEALNAELRRWQESGIELTAPEAGTVAALVVDYKKDERFKRLRDTTQRSYNESLREIIEVFGDIPVSGVTRKQARDFYSSYSHTLRKGSALMAVASVLFNYARDVEIITHNPFSEQKVAKPKPRRAIVSPQQINDTMAMAEQMGLQSIGYAIRLGFETGQRAGDLRMMRRSDYDGQWLRVCQSKTDVTVDIPVFKLLELKAMLDGITHASVLILHEERTGKPYTKDMLSRRVREVFEKAGIGSDIQFRDLRRTAVVRLAEHGCEVPEICAITGHSLKEATTILEVYLPRTRKMAENAIDKVTRL